MKADVRIFDSDTEVFGAAADFVSERMRRAVAQRGACALALAGGSTPRKLYELLASDSWRGGIPWEELDVFWGDERCVGPDDEESNYRMAREAMLAKTPVKPERVRRMVGEHPDPRTAASDYAELLRGSLPLTPAGLPCFDVVLLGMGDDGHTASLFPESPALDVTDQWVAAHYVEKLAAHRMTLTYPVLNAAAAVLFLVTGDSKSEALREVLEGERKPRRYPSQGIQPVGGTLIWLLDRAAAKLLAASSSS